MEQSRTNAERMKPILKAMEQTIEAVRRKRVAGPGGWNEQGWNGGATASRAVGANPGAVQPQQQAVNRPAISTPTFGAGSGTAGSVQGGSQPQAGQGQRLKARPKRPEGMSRPFPNDGYRSAAG